MVQEISPVIQQTKIKLIEKLKPSGWYDVLKSFLTGEEFTEILAKLYTLSKEGKKFTPELKYVFRAFEECPIADMNVVVVGQDPYPTIGVADGISFSCGLTKKTQPSLRIIFEAIERTVYQGSSVQQDPDLSRWSKQGILMLNTALTCQINKIGTHIDIWQSFTAYVFDAINHAKSNVVFVLLGKKAEEYKDLIGDNQQVLVSSHPASAIYFKEKHWNCGDIFNKTNQVLESLGKNKIIW